MPVRQKPRKQFMERQNFIREEVCKMLHAGFIEEVHHPEWLVSGTTIRGTLIGVPKSP